MNYILYILIIPFTYKNNKIILKLLFHNFFYNKIVKLLPGKYIQKPN